MHVSPSIAAAMQRIENRADDVQRAYTPGAQGAFDDSDRAQTSYPVLDELSVAPPANAYFAVRGENGNVLYTRDGSFTIRDGVLFSGNRAVLGFARGRISAISVDGVDRALGRARNVRIGARGDVSYDRTVVDPRSGAAELRHVSAGRIALARFPAGTRLRPDGDFLAAPQGVVPHYGAPEDGSFAAVAPMRRESSGVSIDASLDRLRIAYRELDAMQAVYRAQVAEDKTAMDVVK